MILAGQNLKKSKKKITKKDTAKLLKRVRGKADHLWYEQILRVHPCCEVCGNSDYLQAHHFFPKGQHEIVRYDLENGIVLCRRCHFILHHLGDPSIQATIIENRGKKWYDALYKRAKVKIAGFKTLEWYQKAFEKLNEKNTN